MSGSLVAPVQDSGSWHTGMGPIDSLMQTAEGIGKGDWVEASIMGVATGLETLGAIADPLGALISAGIGWLIEHLEPFTSWLDELAGDPDQIHAFGDTWGNVATHIRGISDQFLDQVGSATSDWDGVAIEAYRVAAKAQSYLIDGFAVMVDGVAAGTHLAGSIVAGVRELVRDALSQLVGYGISKAAQLLSVVLAPKAISEIGAKVAEWATKIGAFVKGLITSMSKLGKGMDDLLKAADDAGQAVKTLASKWDATAVANGKYDFPDLYANGVTPGTNAPTLSNVLYQVGSGGAKDASTLDDRD